jgi:glycosyltransferase involved in cell wall biosynthesis
MGNVLEAYCEGRARFAADPPEMIVASGPPFHNFLAASLLARRFRSRLVLEYRDEWSENPFDWVDKHPDNRRWEAWCLAQADLVIFTTQSQLDHQLGRFSLLERRRCVVIPNGWDPEDFQHFDGQTIDRSNGTITIGFFGNFGAMGDPSLFLSDLAGVLTARPRLRAKFRFRIVGQKTKLALALLRDFPFPECLSTEDQLPKARACREMMAVDYLLLLNPPELARYIQGKLFEYVRSGTRILVYGAGGEAEEIVRTCNAGTIVRPGDVASLAELLEQASTSLKQSSAAEEWLARHKRDRLAAVMIDALNSVAGGAELSRT